jgi:excisionase family DNA binding protein
MNMHKHQKNVTAPADIQSLLTIPEVAAILNVGRTTVYGFIQRDGLPAVTLGGRGNLRVIKSSLLRWITEHEDEHYLD